MSERKPGPLVAVPVRRHCPVCGKASYSLSGEHPQCAVARADKLVRAARKANSDTAGPAPPRQPWSKQCPRCRRTIPARRVICDCGHNFASSVTSSGVPASDVSA